MKYSNREGFPLWWRDANRSFPYGFLDNAIPFSRLYRISFSTNITFQLKYF